MGIEFDFERWVKAFTDGRYKLTEERARKTVRRIIPAGEHECWYATGQNKKRNDGKRPRPSVMIDGKNIKLGRIIVESILMQDTQELLICHRCDNPPCINPNHLWPGTNLDNIRDRVEKGRCNTAKWENAGPSKYTNDEIRCIRWLRNDLNFELKEISKLFGCTDGNVSMIARRITWSELPD